MMVRKPICHPSGRPIRDSEPKRYSQWRVPLDDYATPRLRRYASDLSLVGFHTSYQEPEDEN